MRAVRFEKLCGYLCCSCGLWECIGGSQCEMLLNELLNCFVVLVMRLGGVLVVKV